MEHWDATITEKRKYSQARHVTKTGSRALRRQAMVVIPLLSRVAAKTKTQSSEQQL